MSRFVVGRLIRIIIFLFLLIRSVPFNAYYVGGFYESYYEAWRDGDFMFALSRPKHYFQMRAWLDPFPSGGIYSQISASTLEDEAKIKFDRGFAEKTFGKTKLIALYKEERHWISSPLLYLVDVGKIQRDAFAGRLDFWEIGNFRGTALFSRNEKEKNVEWYGNYFDEEVSANLGRVEYYTGKLAAGLNFIRRDLNSQKYDSAGVFLENYERINTVTSADVRFSPQRFSLLTEVASSKIEGYTKAEDFAWQAELRDFFVGPFGLTFSVFDYGKEFFVDSSRKFTGWDGSSEFGRRGFSGEVYFLVPLKAIDVTYKFSRYKTPLESVETDEERRQFYAASFGEQQKFFWDFSQVYIRMLMGISLRAGLERISSDEERRNFSARIDAETPKQLSGIVFKIADIGKEDFPGEKYLFGIEQKLNLSDNFQFYFRFARGSSDAGFWKSGFWQLRYFIGYDFEVFLEFGESWPTEDIYSSQTFADNPQLDVAKVARFIIKVSF